MDDPLGLYEPELLPSSMAEDGGPDQLDGSLPDAPKLEKFCVG